MVRGKDHGPRIDVEQCSSGPRLNHVVTFTPRIACIHPVWHAVLNGASITSWYRRQMSQQGWTLAQSRSLNRAEAGANFLFLICTYHYFIHTILPNTNEIHARLVFIGMYCNIYQHMVCIVVCFESVFARITKLLLRPRGLGILPRV